MANEPDLQLINVTKCFSGFTAVRQVSLVVARGQFLCLLGPSGCGKTTTLRVIAGLEAADEGEIRIAGARVNETPSWQRDMPRIPPPHLKSHGRSAAGPGNSRRVQARPHREPPAVAT